MSKISPDQGLDYKDVARYQNEFGKNILTLRKPVSALSILFQQVKSIIVVLLAVSAVISLILNQWIEAFSIFAVLLINTLIGFATEYRAIRSMESLRKLGKTTTTVIRNGIQQQIDADELVPHDIVLLEAGDIVSADINIIESSRLSVDESTLTGESVPVEKSKNDKLFRGTFLTNGSCKGVVFATGMKTELGKISKVVQEAHEELTPLEKRLALLGKKLLWISLGIAVFIAVSGIMSGKDIYLILETAVALAVASIPEGLPIVATLALTKGMWRLSKKNVLVNGLSSVETLGATNVILTDKTGTLTENKMTVTKIVTLNELFNLNDPDQDFLNEQLNECLKISALCNNASIHDNSSTGDPMEIALLEAAAKRNIFRNDLIRELPEIKEEAFNPLTRLMATYHQDHENIFVAIKGASESVIAASSFIQDHQTITEDIRKKLLDLNSQMAKDGLRVIALAKKNISKIDSSQTFNDLIFIGLVGLVDPVRSDIKDSIKLCQKAGIKVIMATGDQGETARKIAKDIELDPSHHYEMISGTELGSFSNWNDELIKKINRATIFSRVTPIQKLDLIRHFQKSQNVVAMTGDGVNDAPALKKADIGVAMGKRGTQVAKDAADMILEDDKFSSIILAIKQGRIIFSNIQKFVIYLLSCNISEVFIVTLGTLLNIPLPLLPLQILFLNLVTDVFPALALGVVEGDESYLTNPPRKKDSDIIGKHNWRIIFFYSGIITFSVLTAYFWTLNGDWDNAHLAVSVSFLTLGFAQTLHVFNMRQTKSHAFINDITKNPHIWAAVILCTTLMLATVEIPLLREVLSLAKLDHYHWEIIITCSFIPYLVGLLTNFFRLGIRD